MISDDDLDRLKLDNRCDTWAAKYVKLRKGDKGLVGPCVACSGDRAKKTATKATYWKDGWTCAGCSQGGDIVTLVAFGEGLDAKADFRRIVGLLDGGAALLGRKAEPVSDAERQRAEAARAAQLAEQERDRETWRQKERSRAFELWERRRRIEPGTAAWDYLKLRGLDPALFADRLGFDPAHRFYLVDPKPRLIHTGPALLAMIQRAHKFHGLHRTFIDLAKPKGKAVILHPDDGEPINSKKMRGLKKGGHIAIAGPRDPLELTLGEGIEKVGAVATALHRAGRDLSASAFWTSGDLGNLGGKAADKLTHPFLKHERSGRARTVQGIVPDMNEPAIEIPDSVERLVLLGDSTSDRFETDCAIVRASVRYARPGRTIVAAWPPEGKDFDELLTEVA